MSWGDSRIGNIMFGDDLSVVGVLDWEMASLGSAGLDLGRWLFMQRHHTEGYGLPHPEGFPTNEEVVARYEQLTGRPVKHIEFYEAFAALRGGVIMVRLVDMMIDAGMLPADAEMRHNNPGTRILADLIGAPAPTGTGMTGHITRG